MNKSTGPAGFSSRRLPAAFRVLIAALALSAAGCQNLGTDRERADRVALGVGPNAVGEECRLLAAPDWEEHPGLRSAHHLYCGEWEEPSARIFRAETPGSASQQPLWWRDRLADFTNCAEPVATSILDGVPALAFDCSLMRGEWPYQALAAVIDDSIYLVDGLPASIGPAELAVGALAGRLQPAQISAAEGGTLSAEMQRLQARLGGAAYSAGDLQRYWTLLRLAQHFNFRDDFAEAESHYRQALHLHNRTLPGDNGALGFLYMHIALQLSNQQRFNEADALFAQADQLLQYSLEPADRATFVSYLAIHEANQRSDERAAELAREATDMRRDIADEYGMEAPMAASSVSLSEFEIGGVTRGPGTTSDAGLSGMATSASADLVQSQSVEAAMLVQLGRLDEGERVLGSAFSTLNSERSATLRWLPQLLLVQARLDEQRGDLSAAEQRLRAAIAAQQKLLTRSRAEGRAYLELGRIYGEEGRLEDSLEAFRRGFDIMASQGGALQLDSVLPYFRTSLALARRDPARRDALMAEMFEVGQNVRGPVAAQTMALTAARLAAGEQEVSGLIRELQDARMQRDDLRQRLTVANADPGVLAPQLEELEQQWQTLDGRIASLELEVQSAAPRYNQLVDVPVSAPAVIGALGPGEVIVQVLLGTESSVAFLVDPDGIEAHELDLSLGATRDYVAELRAPFRPTSELASYPVQSAHQLYRSLFGPFSQRLAGADHVIFIPTGPLLSLPAAILVTEPPPAISGYDYGGVTWLLDRHALSLAPSVQSFLNLRQTIQPSRATRPFVGFGDYLPSGDTRTVLAELQLPESCADQANLIAGLPRLPNTAAEVKSVGSYLGAGPEDLYLQAAFSQRSVTESDLADYRVIYFATHGLMPYRLSCLPEPALTTSRAPGDEGPGNGLLLAGDVAELKLDADLVVLSACDTGGPAKQTGGEALTGLARAFFYSGARSMLVTHWEIPDQPTVDIMTGTFRRMSEQGLSLARALQESQKEMIHGRGLSHPIVWGAFNVVGDGALKLETGPSTTTAARATESAPM